MVDQGFGYSEALVLKCVIARQAVSGDDAGWKNRRQAVFKLTTCLPRSIWLATVPTFHLTTF
jgi:hypothetical protein